MKRALNPSAPRPGARNPGRRNPVQGLLRGTTVVLCIAALAGCGTLNTVKGWFGSDTSQEVEPAELIELSPTVAVTQLWSARAGTAKA